MNFNRLIESAYALKGRFQTGRAFHFAAILSKSKILSIATNNYSKTHPQTLQFNYQPNSRLHAEMSAALKLGLQDCSGLTIVSIRIDNNNRLNNAIFCPGCKELIKQLNFKNCYHTDKNGNFIRYEQSKTNPTS